MDAVTVVPEPRNEPVRRYGPGSPERASLERRLGELAGEQIELTMTIDGVQRMGGGDPIEVVQPHRRRHVLGIAHNATNSDADAAVTAAKRAAAGWRDLPFEERAAIFLRAADLLAGPWRDTLNGATMLGQSKSVQQAEIDSGCELIDFLRYNVYFAHKLLGEQLVSAPGGWNRFDHRPLEGFVYAITPFNFTAIAGNLPTSVALVGNTVVWKPSPTQQFAAHHIMRLLEAAGLPPGVINLVTGDGIAVSEVALTDPHLVGETGGKDFVIAHSSADADALHTALVRGAFEYQGQKCSAASRAYVPRSIWDGGLRDRLAAAAEDRIKNAPACTVLAGGTADDREGFFVRPTVVECTDPTHEVFTTEYFGPILAVHVFDDDRFEDAVRQADSAAPYALTGSIFATDRAIVDWASRALRFTAGNFYINDKPTGAIVGQQPFGGARASGTNDKAGSWHNLVRWMSPRTIKETFVPETDHRYPHMG